MSNADIGNMALVALIVLQQGFYMWMVQKLINKLMSRDFHEYQKAHQTQTPPRIMIPGDDPPEDLRPLQGFTM